MKRKIISLFIKAYNKLLRRKNHRAIWGQKVEDYSPTKFINPDGSISRKHPS